MSQYKQARVSTVIGPEEQISKGQPSYTEGPSRYRQPRAFTVVVDPDGTERRVLTKTGRAGALAQLVRERFYARQPRGRRWCPLRSFMIQAFKLFKDGFTFGELRLAIEEAATAPWCRTSRPAMLRFFIPWLIRIRRRGLREDTWRREQVREREQDREALTYIEALCGVALGERLRVAPTG